MTVNFVKVMLVRVVVVVFVAVLAVVVCVHAKCPDAKRSARRKKKPHRISCDMPQYFPLTR